MEKSFAKMGKTWLTHNEQELYVGQANSEIHIRPPKEMYTRQVNKQAQHSGRQTKLKIKMWAFSVYKKTFGSW